MAVASLSCVRYARFRRAADATGTCYGACVHYLSCKQDESPDAYQTCKADCTEIFVQDGEPDRDSLKMFEGLDCKMAVAFVDGDDHDRNATANAPAHRVRSRAR